jgi:hypothetical protein
VKPAIQLDDNWKRIVGKAWSFKFSALAFALTAGEVYVAIKQPLWIEPGTFAIMSGVITIAAMGARVVAQKEFGDEK